MIMNRRERLKKWLTQQIFYPWHCRYLWNPPANGIQGAIKQYAEQAGQIFFVQIGANDGYKNDPVYRFVRSYGWKGILVEPQNEVCEHRLKVTYADHGDLHFANVAVGPERNSKKLYKIAFSSARWATGLASFDRENIEKHIDNGYVQKWAAREGVSLPDRREDYITHETVTTITFEDLLERFGRPSIDAIFIDTEGFDYQVLQCIDLETYRPDIILFEEMHIPAEKRRRLIERFDRLGYTLKREDRDILAHRLPHAPPE